MNVSRAKITLKLTLHRAFFCVEEHREYKPDTFHITDIFYMVALRVIAKVSHCLLYVSKFRAFLTATEIKQNWLKELNLLLSS